MRAEAVLVQLALCVTAIVAFFPYQPGWHKEKQGIKFEIQSHEVKGGNMPSDGPPAGATRMSSKYGGPRNVEMVTNDAHVKRDNRYNIQKAVDPNKPLTAGINQDGTDFAYFVRVEIGSKKKELYMLLDTGAGSSWVMGPGCKDEACSMHSSFGPNDSDTFHDTGEDFNVSYGSGVVNGKLVEDNMTLAGVTFDFKFGMAGNTSTEFVKFPFDGILGLSMTRGHNDNFLEKFGQAQKLDKNIFCVALNRAADGVNTGEVKFGSMNPDKFSGNVSYTPLGSQDGEWAIPIDDMAYDGKKAGVGGVLAYIDTGTSFVFGSQDRVQKVHSVIPGAKSADGQTYKVPCDTNKPLTFTFSGIDYEVSPKDWIAPKNEAGECTSNVYGYEVAKGSWLIGDTFLMNVYTVFDKDEKRIGFAKLAESKQKQTTTSSTSRVATNAETSATSEADSSVETVVSTQSLGGHEAQSGGGSGGVAKPKETATSAAVGGYFGKVAFETRLGSEDVHSIGRLHSTTTRAMREQDGGLLAGDGDSSSSSSAVMLRLSEGRDEEQIELEDSGAGHSRQLVARDDDGEDGEDGEEEDDDDNHVDGDEGRRSHRVPLLTNMEAPSVAVANSWGDDEVQAEMRRPKSGLQSAFMNMANSIIGAGIIGQPYAFRQAGLLAGVLLLVGLTVVVDWTICLIVINSKLSGTSSFQGTVEHCFGRPGLVAISVAQWVFAFGGMVAFGVIVGDTIPHVLTAVWPDLGSVPVLGLLTDRRMAIAVFILGVSYPLTLYRDIAKLAKASTFALIGMMVIVTTVLVQGMLVPSEARGSFSTPLLTVNGGIFQAIGVISFAFVCHHNSLLIYGSLRTPTMDNFSRVTHYSTGVSMLACLVMALAGFLTFGDKTMGNVLNNFATSNGMVNLARLFFGLNMLTTLPLEAFVCREVMLTYWYADAGFDLVRHVVLSTGLVVSATAVSLLTCDLGVVFELVGATSAVAMAYILPPLCYIRLTRRSWRTYVAYAVVVFGVAVMLISLLQAFADLFTGGKGKAEGGGSCR
ncbi:hypothetical protein L249_0364 [Ophiocordyceps polyrhachis-furcata BCC 54312]|uniref:Peptidase A1 domain-containing protein n=1 Tax=Ophiocordyceps polyrhachis-furcata BCC 54312 TaxID=1330021 RepID=A0A367LFK3_9HYPO|nr:hypothetical protein L249_0364 [Ophiocordyceps polyrhachis-furcata BCC 54312]